MQLGSVQICLISKPISTPASLYSATVNLSNSETYYLWVRFLIK